MQNLVNRTLTEFYRKNIKRVFDELPAIRQIYQIFLSSNFCTIQYLFYVFDAFINSPWCTCIFHFSFVNFGIFVSHENQFCGDYEGSTEQIHFQYKTNNANWITLGSYNSEIYRNLSILIQMSVCRKYNG